MGGVAGMVVVWCVLAWAEGVVSQRAPCYHCELQKETPPHSSPYTTADGRADGRTDGRTEGRRIKREDRTRYPQESAEVRAHCVYPCGCGTVPVCRPGVPLVRDGCDCCYQCAGQAGESCDGATICDASKNLTCVYHTCQEVQPARCSVNNRTYDDGENFTLDCRTQCTCQNGTYACVSLCPSENIPPSAQCHNPHLVTVAGQCCREWMCDTAPGKVVGPPQCERGAGRWSKCSLQTCGAGVSVRWSTDNARCQLINQTRLCQLRPCQDRRQKQLTLPYLQPGADPPTRKHHIRRGHTCKATQRHVTPVRLRAGWCVSERRYRPKLCGWCTDRCCTVHTSTTITIAFLCPLHANTNLLPRPPPRPSTHAPSVYDMMDEGQPVMEAVLSSPQRQHRTRPPSDLTYDDDDDPHYDEDDLDDQLPFEHENLTVEDDVDYNDIKSDNYEIVRYQVEWIVRCKCSDTACDTYDEPAQYWPPPTPTHPPTHT